MLNQTVGSAINARLLHQLTILLHLCASNRNDPTALKAETVEETKGRVEIEGLWV
jgi:hypothetical protein